MSESCDISWTELVTNLTTWSKELIKKLMASHELKIYPSFYRVHKLIRMLQKSQILGLILSQFKLFLNFISDFYFL
jgi:hypothetical protein